MRHTAYIAFVALALSACSGETDAPAPPPTSAEIAETLMTDTEQTESQKARAFFDEVFMNSVMRNPMFQDYLGIKKDQDKWPDITEERAAEDQRLIIAELSRLQSEIDFDKLDDATRLSYRLWERNATEQIEDYRWRYHNYPVNQMYGMQSGAPTHLINLHRVSQVKDAENYVARLNGLGPFFDQLITNLKKREELGIVAPKFVYPYVLNGSAKVITGAPFDGGKDSALWADYQRKVEGLEIEPSRRDALLASGREALLSTVKPAYERLIAYIEGLASRAGTDDGVWKWPDGAEFYANALQRTTTTDMTPSQIHDLGLSEVARIHGEMRDIMQQVGFEGSLQDFFKFMREDKQFYFDETPEGKQAYLQQATALIDTMRDNLDKMFIVKPKAALEVKAVEAYREASAGKAFYNRPTPDGSRPGTYYANLYRMSDMPTYQMEALAYHEGIPGHHMQIAIALELENVPQFRKWNGVTAYTEGWGLYSELLPKEFGFYADPYSDFGRLAMELWRACRLVVDTGMHDKRWTREEAIDYLATNSPNPQGDVVKAIERYVVMPSQATAYKIGMIKIVELRAKAQQSLGDRFDLREFHDVILKNGPVPLAVLEELVDDYITQTKG